MIDTHCHLTDERLLSQFDAVLARARDAGVTQLITVGTDISDSQAAVALCQGRANLRCTVGVHPNYSENVAIADVEVLHGLQQDAAVVALGEMGLDYFHGHAARQHQAAIFRRQLEIASELGRPVVIHCREAVHDTLAILQGFSQVPAVFHCFTGTVDEAKRIIDAGYLIGLTGVVTYKRSDDLRAVARFVPDDRLLVETDAPYLTPEPVRKIKTNEPAFVMHTAGVVARERGLTLDAFDALTTANARKFFGMTAL